MIEKLKDWVENSTNIVFFGGAGVSTESGIPDFRSVDGLYSQTYQYPPETILSHSFFRKHRDAFFQFYWDKMICRDAQPNITHIRLAQLEKEGKVRAVITQNIDGLHQMAGSKNVLELHGSVHRNYCTNCSKFYSLEDIMKENVDNLLIPRCECGGVIKPDVVLYEESLDDDIMDKTMYYITNADMLIVGGTSLSVYPAAGFIRYFNGDKLVLINKTKTAYDEQADLVLNCGLGEVFSKI